MATGKGLNDLLALASTELWALPPVEVEEPPEPVDTYDDVPQEPGAQVLDDVVLFLRRHVAFPEPDQADVVALWAAQTYGLDAFDSTPRLALLSPVKECGKTRLLEVLSTFACQPVMTENISVAALFRDIDNRRPTVLIDEVDKIFKPGSDTAELPGNLNSGHRRGADVLRCVGDNHDVKPFKAVPPVALAGIGNLPDTLLSRCIVIAMRRRAPGETVKGFRERETRPEGQVLGRRLGAWVTRHLDALAQARPEMPSPISDDRPADMWEPLIAIADLAGREWPARARGAAVRLQSERATRDPNVGIQLLADIRQAFIDVGTDRLPSESLAGRLCHMEDPPWADYRGKPIDGRRMARLLHGFDIRPHSIRISGKVAKGYEAADFHDAWARYLPDEEGRHTPGATLFRRTVTTGTSGPPAAPTPLVTSHDAAEEPVTDAENVTVTPLPSVTRTVTPPMTAYPQVGAGMDPSDDLSVTDVTALRERGEGNMRPLLSQPSRPWVGQVSPAANGQGTALLERPLEWTAAVGSYWCNVCGTQQYARVGDRCGLHRGTCPGRIVEERP